LSICTGILMHHSKILVNPFEMWFIAFTSHILNNFTLIKNVVDKMALNKLRNDSCFEDSSLLGFWAVSTFRRIVLPPLPGSRRHKRVTASPRRWGQYGGYATGCTTKELLLNSRQKTRNFFSILEGSAPVQTDPGAHQTLLYNGYSGLFLLG